MSVERNTYDPQTADPSVQSVVTELITSHQQHGTTADTEQEAIARRKLRFVSVGGKRLSAAYIDSALAYARKAADLKASDTHEPGRS
jgi:hypothetical protein